MSAQQFDFATAFSVISIVFGVLTVAITVVGSYVGYLAITLPKRIREITQSELAKVTSLIAIRLQILNSMMESLHASGKGDENAKEMSYLLTHIMRLGSEDQSEIERSLLALEGFGTKSLPLLPLAERMRSASSWNEKNKQNFEAFLSKMRMP